MRFKNRTQAGQLLAQSLKEYKNKPDTIVLGIARGGIENAAIVAKELNLPLDCIVVRKLALPSNPEFAIGALTQNGTIQLNPITAQRLHITEDDITDIVTEQKQEITRRLEKYRGSRAPLNLTNKTAIIIDDGIATGATTKAAIDSARALGAQKIILAVPVCPRESTHDFSDSVDKFICLYTPPVFYSVGQFYEQFPQVDDNKVTELMKHN